MKNIFNKKYRTGKFPSLTVFQLKFTFKLFLSYLFLFSFFRILFTLIFYSSEDNINFSQFVKAYITGFQFDIATIFLTAGIPALFLFVPVKNKKYYIAISYIFYTLFFISFGVLISDLVYYAEAGKKVGFEILIFFQNISVVLNMALTTFWYSLIFLAAGFILFSLLWKKLYVNNFPELKYLKFKLTTFIFSFLGFVFILAIGIRGIHSTPLKPNMAFQNENMFLGYIALNGLYNSYLALYEKDHVPYQNYNQENSNTHIKELIYAENETALDKDYNFYRKINTKKKEMNYNVLIIIMESWGSKDLGINGNRLNPSPFFDSLTSQGLYFTHHYSTGQRTTPVFSSIVSSIPSLFGRSYTTASYNKNNQRGFAKIFKEKGYKTLLLYSSKKGSMGISDYAPIAGFEKIITKENFDLSKVKTDGVWGVYDEYGFQRLHEELENMGTNFAALIKTIHPHPPFTMPHDTPYYTEKTKMTPFYNSMRYTDECLKKFFTLAKNSSYYNNTLFIIMGDHAYGDKKGIEKFHTPLLFFAPGFIKPETSNMLVSQLDILPSILHLLNIETVHSSFGQSFINNNKYKPWAIIDFESFEGFMTENYTALFTVDSLHGIYNHNKDPHLTENLFNELNKTNPEIIKTMREDWQILFSSMAYAVMNNKIAAK
ncbi:MAG: sulfatase-like hydrolase/transferase [Spirochaetia bacterium]|nr:sulfatase-like hydrolase/transferase [Spirochaetia bacterium]